MEHVLETLPDTTLMEHIKAGNERAFRILVNRHLPKSHAIARRVLRSAQDAEEAAQDTFTKVWVNAYRFDPNQASFGTWFYRILTNTCLDMARKRTPGATELSEMEDLLADESVIAQDESLAQQQENKKIKLAMHRLSEKQRIAVTLCYFEEMTNQEAAAAMNIHIKALEGLLVRAKKQLREWLDEYE